MPRLTPAHEEEIERRIVFAAAHVFAEMGFRRATMQDICRASGLSVGAVYSHFKSKEELFLLACHDTAETEKQHVMTGFASIEGLTDRLRSVIDYSLSFVGDAGGDNRRVLVHAWAEINEAPELRRMLLDRRAQMTGFARLVLQEGVARNELPGWVDLDGIAAAFVSFIDGLIVKAAESGDAEPDAMRREAYALLDLLLAAPAEKPRAVDELRAPRPSARAAAAR